MKKREGATEYIVKPGIFSSLSLSSCSRGDCFTLPAAKRERVTIFPFLYTCLIFVTCVIYTCIAAFTLLCTRCQSLWKTFSSSPPVRDCVAISSKSKPWTRSSTVPDDALNDATLWSSTQNGERTAGERERSLSKKRISLLTTIIPLCIMKHLFGTCQVLVGREKNNTFFL